MVSIEPPSRTTRPRVSSASTANGRTTSSAASKAPSFIACASCLDGAEAPGEDALLGVQPVLGLVEHDRARAVHDLVGDLLAAMRRQAMHEDRLLAGGAHQPGVDLVGLEQIVTAALVLVAIETQQSVTTAATAANGSRVTMILAPSRFAQLRSSGRGSSSGGVATASPKSSRAAAWTHEAKTLLASPVQATVRPRIGPRCSSKVRTSAMTWHGCEVLVSPLITGTVACSASSSIIAWSRMRIMMAST